MNAQLTELCEQLRSNGMRAQTLVSKAGEARMAIRPKPGSWSAAECLAHLTLSTELFLPVWRTAFVSARGAPTVSWSDGPIQNGPPRQRFLHWVLQPPPKIRVKAPAGLQPVAAAEVLSGFLLSQAQLFNVISESVGLALDRIKIASPVAARVRYNVWSSFRATDAHQRRHLWQAERAAGLSE